MGWLSLSELESRTFHDVITEIETGSPRAIAIVAGAFVEDHLTRVLRWRLVRSPIKSGVNLQDNMLRSGGALGDFGNKINLAYLIGLISKDAWKELDTIRLIRNRFAHQLEVNNFGVQQIEAWCDNLSLWEKIKIKIGRTDESGKPQSLRLVMGPDIEEQEQAFPLVDFITPGSTILANERYIAACKFYIAAFSIIIHEKRPTPTPWV